MDRFERAGEVFTRLCRTMATLRVQCPWDREQTFDSLRPYLIEETYEVLEVMEADTPAAHRDELGDLLLQIVFQAEIAQESGAFEIADVVNAIDEKLVRRHPHVFASGDSPSLAAPQSEAGTKRSWEGIKAAERGADASCLDGIPKAMPALLRAARMGEKAATVGFDWPEVAGVIEKVEEEWDELREQLDADPASQQEELGDLLFALVSLGRHLRLDPETALNDALDKFDRRLRAVEQTVRERGERFSDLGIDQLDALWEDAKSSKP